MKVSVNLYDDGGKEVERNAVDNSRLGKLSVSCSALGDLFRTVLVTVWKVNDDAST